MTAGPATAAGVTGFEAFYRREHRRLYEALAFSLADPALAMEAVDEGMARAYARWGRVAAYDNPAGWVYRVALNWSRSAWRKRRRVVPGDVPDRGRLDPEPIDGALWRAVAALPQAQRDVVVLRFHLDWSHDRIAAALDVPVGTVKSRLHRGLGSLRQELEDRP